MKTSHRIVGPAAALFAVAVLAGCSAATEDPVSAPTTVGTLAPLPTAPPEMAPPETTPPETTPPVTAAMVETPTVETPTTETPTAAAPSAVHYANCTAARAAGAAPLYTDDPGYSSSLDRDHDGLACES